MGGLLPLSNNPKLRCEEASSSGPRLAARCWRARAPLRGLRRVCALLSAALPVTTCSGICFPPAALLLPPCLSLTSLATARTSVPLCQLLAALSVLLLPTHPLSLPAPVQASPIYLPNSPPDLPSLHHEWHPNPRIPPPLSQTFLFLSPARELGSCVLPPCCLPGRSDRCELSTHRFLTHSCRTTGGQGKASLVPAAMRLKDEPA